MDTTLDWELMAIIGLLCGIWRLLFEIRDEQKKTRIQQDYNHKEIHLYL